ncbi:MAG: hypothetical protein U1D66_14510, partial [Erythrobacter sp.]|nr:hypothetical protein [Erythrobacter sp.]
EERRPARRAARPDSGQPRAKGKPAKARPDRDAAQSAPRPAPKPAPKPSGDTGPARASGAFDKLADLLKR